jgi:hypothetical protein
MLLMFKNVLLQGTSISTRVTYFENFQNPMFIEIVSAHLKFEIVIFT